MGHDGAQQLADVDCVTGGDRYLADQASDGGTHLIFHLHGFDDHRGHVSPDLLALRP